MSTTNAKKELELNEVQKMPAVLKGVHKSKLVSVLFHWRSNTK